MVEGAEERAAWTRRLMERRGLGARQEGGCCVGSGAGLPGWEGGIERAAVSHMHGSV